MIAPQNTPAAQAAQADEEARQARRDEVQKVIKAGGGPAKCCERFFPVPDQAVGGVDGLIGPYAGKAADKQPEKRRDDAVAEAFREAFYSGARNACFPASSPWACRRSRPTMWPTARRAAKRLPASSACTTGKT